MTKKALLVGSSFSAAPIFFALKRRGLEVVVCGNLRDDPCHQYADGSIFIDYSNKETLLGTVETDHFDYLIPSCNDYAYMACTWVAERCGFPGYDSYDTACVLFDKQKFRAFTAANELPAPRTAWVAADETDQIAAAGRFGSTLLVKPVDSFSGRGVTKVGDPAALDAAVARARASSRSGSVVIEEFVDGSLHSHSAFIRDGAIVFDAFVDEYCTVYPYQVDCSNHPSWLPDTTRAAVRSVMQRLISLLHLNDGLLHTQFMVNGERFWIIECMRRCPGDLYGHLVELSTGAAYTDMLVRPFVGEPMTPSPGDGSVRFYGRHTISTDRPQVPLSFSHTIPAIDLRVVPLKTGGQRLDAAPFDKQAILFAEFADYERMLEISPRFRHHVTLHSLTGTPT